MFHFCTMWYIHRIVGSSRQKCKTSSQQRAIVRMQRPLQKKKQSSLCYAGIS